jgi:hypothetical protein
MTIPATHFTNSDAFICGIRVVRGMEVYLRKELKMERYKKILMVASIGLIIFPIFLNSAFAFDKLFIVGDQAALGLAKDFLTTLNNESIPLVIVMDQFDKVKNEKYIIVLGGAKGPGGVDEFIKQVLTAQEQESGNQPGGKMFVKENVFTQGQTIIVFTGPETASAANARKSNRNTWWPYLVKWFDLDTSAPMAY